MAIESPNASTRYLGESDGRHNVFSLVVAEIRDAGSRFVYSEGEQRSPDISTGVQPVHALSDGVRRRHTPDVDGPKYVDGYICKHGK